LTPTPTNIGTGAEQMMGSTQMNLRAMLCQMFMSSKRRIVSCDAIWVLGFEGILSIYGSIGII
jgi:hypothetical protein